MSKTYLVARREFLATVLTKGFLLGILLPPIIGGVGITLVPLLMNAAAPKTIGTIAVIDRSGKVSEELAKTLSPEGFRARAAKKLEQGAKVVKSKTGFTVPTGDPSMAQASKIMEVTSPTLDVKVLPPDANAEAEKKPILEANVRGGDGVDAAQRVALVEIPKAAIEAPPLVPGPGSAFANAPFEHYSLFAAPRLDLEVRNEISDAVDRAIVNARLRDASIDPESVRALSAPPITESKVVTPEGERADNGVAAMFVPGGFLVLLWISVIVGGQGLLLSTIEEKSSRVMEVLLSAVSPVQLMVGKILGQMAVASLIMGLYAFSAIGALIAFHRADMLDTTVLICTPIYFIIAFFIMASMMAAVGSVVNDIREAQALMQPFMFVMVIPMVLWLPISRSPNALWAQVVSLIPPVSPFVMVVRLAGSEPIPVWQIPASMIIGVLAMVFMGWATAKVFRIGVLMYGKPPDLKTLIRWVRMA